MEREETNSSHLVSNRLSLWCPVCGAVEGKPCTEVKHGLRFSSHDAYATGNIIRPQVQYETAMPRVLPARKDAPKRGWTPGGWVN